MNTLIYRPFGWMLNGLSRLPLKVLYLAADMIFAVMYHMVRYRRRVVMDNIASSFPDMTAEECRRTCREFYRNFSDYIVETIKLGHISDDEMRRRMTFENIEAIDSLVRSGRSVVCYFAHCFNWEWAPSISLWTGLTPGKDFVFGQVYRPLANKWFDSYLLHLRSRFHTLSYPKSTVLRELIRSRHNGMPTVCGFMSDQKPSHGDPTHVVRFLNHPTAMITGTEHLARKLDSAVVYMDIHKLSRGHYRIVIRPITSRCDTLPDMSITERYASLLQQTIRRNPAIWLWSHKRWKIPVTLPSNS
ncbi:MAG: lysophospholipid acyltransferase family protein [Muribaculaceae bacterium]|nr:lysophospholipid acyltransferase family protein [Muribaculaceae bacterium]